MIKRQFFSNLLLLFTISCSTYKVPDSKLPSWYITPKTNNSISIYGVGEGYTSEEATKSALNNLSSKLMTSISSETTMVLEENKFGTNEENRRRINEVVAKTTFNNYQITNSAQQNNKIYVEIAVSRPGFTENYSSRLFKINENMSKLFRQAESKSILEKRNSLLKISDMAKEAETISYILSGLGFSDYNFNLDQNLKLYNSYNLAYDQILDQIEFFIVRSDNTNTRVIDLIRSDLNKRKIKISTRKDITNNNLVFSVIKSDATNYKIYGSFITKLRVDISIYSNNSKLIASNFVETTGNSIINQEEALNAAISAFGERISKEGILGIVGI